MEINSASGNLVTILMKEYRNGDNKEYASRANKIDRKYTSISVTWIAN